MHDYSPIYEPTDPRNNSPRWMVLSGEPPIHDVSSGGHGGSWYRNHTHVYPDRGGRTIYRVNIDGVDYIVRGQKEAAKLCGCSVEAVGFHIKRRNNGLDPLTRSKKGSKIRIYKEAIFK